MLWNQLFHLEPTTVMMVTERYLGSSFTGLRLCFFGKVESGWSWLQGREAKVKNIKSEQSFFILLFAFQVHNVHGAFNALEGADKLSSNRGYSGDCSSQPPSAGGKAGPFMQHWCIQESFIGLFSQNDPDTAGWHFHFLQCYRKGLAQKVLWVLVEFFIHILFL